MKDYLKRSGLAAFIIVSVAATAFLPKRISQAVILAAFLIWLGLALFRLWNKHKAALKTSKKEKKYHKPDQEKISAEVHLSHRITDKLHSAYPNATWRWKGGLSNEFLEKGGSARIETSDTDEYNEAEITLDRFGRIGIEMIKAVGINDVIRDADKTAPVEFTSDVRVWYELKGKDVLTETINELNAKGNKTLSISEDGSITVGEGTEVGKLPSFPSKTLWSKLAEVIEGEGLKIVQNEASLDIGW